ncbi:tRNA epoxyqueuosine(34) reductase QueG [Cyanobacterium sp. IPPAS B-1200]|uniref:tRNA epoxyqueuosine(34) reductase QueG n=1 Tax=Cyanobacterium sp. IPPAS B-1200 TaxID=1562720 RepID=UPI0008528CBF|nr:tRNA epoxyqueuosine(34) reductase QueG [Cyanobacterium sp. IPPAS B-1200]OEJ79635.1 epoxyqueuosine reductase [Cyanobacterium sp. IPPAS B-1200]
MKLTAEEVKQKAKDIGFHEVGIASVEEVGDYHQRAVNNLQKWLDKGYQAEMKWMGNPKRQNIKECMEGVESVISVALNYYTPHERSGNPEDAKISRYGWGRDYHRIIQKRLKVFAQWFNDMGIEARYYVDTGPIQDKVWAQKAGIGWIAKNGNVITRNYGSWVFLGEILVNIPLDVDKPHTNHCGTCTRCISACPTDAITEPFVVDANRCIAYHTIENRAENLPSAIAPNLNNWVAGCDICQDVCPWNQRFAQPTDVEDFNPYPENLNPKLTELAQLSDEEWDKRFTASALRRIKPAMWRRNAQAQIEMT